MPAAAHGLEEGDLVRTPSGAVASIVRIFAYSREALVEWPDGERARFRFRWLKPADDGGRP